MDPRFPLEAPLHDLCCDRQPQDREALTFVWQDDRVERLTFGAIAAASRALAERFVAAGVGQGTPVALVLGQCPLAAVAHLALSRLGAVAVPLSPLFGPDGLAPRLAAARPALALAHTSKEAHVREAAPELPLAVSSGDLALPDLPRAREVPGIAGVAGESPPMALIFTSGTTAQPKGALLPHRVVPGRMPGLLRAHPGFPTEGDRFWSPADWAWIGGLYDSLLAPWAAGVPVLAYERHGPFDPARAATLLEQQGVRNVFMPPTALRLWMRSGAPAPQLRTLHTAGEPLPETVHAWAAKAFGAPPREVYGLTECAFIVVNEQARPAVTGKVVPGHAVGIVREDGSPCRAGEAGELTVRRGSPTMMLGYLRDGRLELPLDRGGWFHTGDLARRNPDGHITVLGRADDVVKVGGYRVAPREVEAELLKHPAVEECAVVAMPDEVRGHALAAHVVPAPGHPPGDALAAELAAYVRQRLAAHLVPKRFTFAAELPKTPSGKVQRSELRLAGGRARRAP